MNTDKSWLIVNVQIAREAEDAASDLLFELGTTGIVTPEESAESLKLTAYFDDSKDADEIIQLIETAYLLQFVVQGVPKMFIHIFDGPRR